MTHTVIGMFDSDYDAQNAVEALTGNGIEKKYIDISHRRKPGTGSADENRDRESGLATFFKNIFGDQHEDADRYSRVALEMASVVTVYTRSEEEAGRVADILDEQGAVDVDERATKYAQMNRTGQVKNTQTGPGSGTSAGQTGTRPGKQEGSHYGQGNLVGEDPETPTNREVSGGPGVGAEPTGGKRSKSRVIPFRGEASARLREDRDSETKFW